jgi:hypothetical protein
MKFNRLYKGFIYYKHHLLQCQVTHEKHAFDPAGMGKALLATYVTAGMALRFV